MEHLYKFKEEMDRINQEASERLQQLLSEVKMSEKEMEKLSNFTLKQKIIILENIKETPIARTLFDMYDPATEEDLKYYRRHALCDYEEGWDFIGTLTLGDCK